MAVAAERLQSSDASRFWSNVVDLLYAAAAAHDAEAVQKVRPLMQHELQYHRRATHM